MITPLFGFLGGLGTTEVLLILLAILLLFGAKKIPELARGLGQGIREFKGAANNVKKEIDNESKQVKDAAEQNSQQQQAHYQSPKSGQPDSNDQLQSEHRRP
jgi:sec-independent protein translocase protein TatA